MSLHSRPIPAPKSPLKVAASQLATPTRPEPPPAPQVVSRPSEGEPRAEPSRAPESRVAPAAAEEASLPWYRSEPWIVALLVGFAPLLATFIAPDTAQYPLIGLSVVAMVIGAIMLLQQGVHRPHPKSRSI